MNFLRAYKVSGERSKPGDEMPFLASTANVARDGLIIASDAWELDNYRKNPVFLWCHDYYSRPPIGVVTNLDPAEEGLRVKVKFDQEDEFAVAVERKYIDGYMNAVSVGWDTLGIAPSQNGQPPTVLKADLLDISAVPVPADPDALKERQARALEAFAKEILAGGKPPATPSQAPEGNRSISQPLSWAEAAEGMVRLYTPFAPTTDDERTKQYHALASVYARHGKTPPELLPTARVDALTSEEIAGLFSEGEPELFRRAFAVMGSRKGQVLSARNLSDITDARDKLNAVLERASAESDDAEAERLMRMLASTFGLEN
jgi:HK97 family phage prohead protease